MSNEWIKDHSDAMAESGRQIGLCQAGRYIMSLRVLDGATSVRIASDLLRLDKDGHLPDASLEGRNDPI